MPLKPTRVSRGFLMLEALVAGAVIGAVLIGVVHQLASSQRSLSVSARRTVAVSAVNEALSTWKSVRFTAVTDGTRENWVAVAGSGLPADMLARKVEIAGAPSSCAGCKEVRVQVRFRGTNGAWESVGGKTWVMP